MRLPHVLTEISFARSVRAIAYHQLPTEISLSSSSYQLSTELLFPNRKSL